MSRETLLDEAIAKAKEAGDWQLVDWLRMARGGESAARWYTKKLRELEVENAKLRNLVQKFSKFERNGCHECPMEEDCKVPCVYDGDCGMAVEIDEEMRELGIEVEQ